MLSLKKLRWGAVLVFLTTTAVAQNDHPIVFIRITQPQQDHIDVSSSRHYMAGSTCKSCVLTMNGKPVKVYPTGAFAIQLDLMPGDTMFNLEATSSQGEKFEKPLYYNYTEPPPELADSVLTISSITTYPVGNLELAPGNLIQIRMKGLSGCKASWLNGQPLYELPPEMAGGIRGIYQGQYMVKENDTALHGNLTVTLTDPSGQQTSRVSAYQFYPFPASAPAVGMTIGDIPYLVYGLGTDRLGAAKMGYIDTAVLLHITGKFNNEYQVQLSENLQAYIPIDNVELLPQGTFLPFSQTSSWKVFGDASYDYVKVGLSEKLPYSSRQDPDPSKIVVDVYGAVSNTNWITQLQNTGEIKSAYYEQVQADVFRIFIELKHPLFWGYRIYYEGKTLVIQVKHRPALPGLAHLKIAIDAGHGGTNLGALSPTGVYEKELTLEVAFILRDELEKAGAQVFMTRTTDISLDMSKRILMLRKVDPDLLVSIHMNSSDDPIHVKGTSTYYRYPGFRPLSEAIYEQMVQLGLDGFGNVGSFNFALNGATEYPNALVETLFISNPADEMKILDPQFRQKVAGAILQGIRDFLTQEKP